MAFWSRLRRRLRPPRRLRLTREGRLFVIISIGIGLAAVNTGNNLLYLMLGWLLSMIVASGVLSEGTLRKLIVTRRPPPQIFAGRPFLMEIAVENEKGRLSSFSLEIEDLIGGRPIDKKCYFLKVPSGKQQRTSYRHTFPRRGLYSFDGFRIATKFPFGLFTKSRQVDATTDVIVFPEVREIPPPTPKARNQGENLTDRVGRAGEFFGLREYRTGDDRRAIHWRSSARLGRMLVREYEEEAQRRATLIVDNALPANASEGDEEALEAAVSLAASLANTYIRLGYAVSLVARESHVRLAAGPLQLTRILKALALLPTVSPETAYSGLPEPNGENLLIVPQGGSDRTRPHGVTQVLEAV